MSNTVHNTKFRPLNICLVKSKVALKVNYTLKCFIPRMDWRSEGLQGGDLYG